MRLSALSTIAPTAATLVLLAVPASAIFFPANDRAEFTIKSGFTSAAGLHS